MGPHEIFLFPLVPPCRKNIKFHSLTFRCVWWLVWKPLASWGGIWAQTSNSLTFEVARWFWSMCTQCTSATHRADREEICMHTPINFFSSSSHINIPYHHLNQKSILEKKISCISHWSTINYLNIPKKCFNCTVNNFITTWLELMLANQYEGATSMTRAICLSGKRESGTWLC